MKIALLKISFCLLLIMASFHTFFILIGGPTFPTTPDFTQMQDLMGSVEFDTGGGVSRTMQDILNGFNIIVSIFLYSLPLLSWLILREIGDKPNAISKLTLVNLLAMVAFFFTSMSLLAIGGTMISGLICLLLVASMFVKERT